MESLRETAPGKHSRQHPHDEISEELNHAFIQSQTQEIRQTKPIGTPFPHASAIDFSNDFLSESTHDTNDRRSIRLEPIIHGILDTPPLTSVRPRKKSRHYSTTTSPLFHHYAWDPTHKKMEFLRTTATIRDGSEAFALCIPYCWKVPSRGTAEVERARKPSSSAPATLGRSNTSLNPAIGAPTFGVSAPGPVAVADTLHLLSQPQWSPINFTRPVARGSASNSNYFIAEAKGDERGASYRDGFVRIPFAPRKFACFVESRDATTSDRTHLCKRTNKAGNYGNSVCQYEACPGHILPLSVSKTSPSVSTILRTRGKRLRRSRTEAVTGIVIRMCITRHTDQACSLMLSAALLPESSILRTPR